MFFQGYILAQLAEYVATASRGDRWLGLRLYTGIVAFACVLQTIIEIYKAWHFVVDDNHWSRSPLRGIELLANAVVGTLVQSFFIFRCWKATHSLILAIYMPFLLISELVLYIYLSIAVRGKLSGAFYEGVDTFGAAHKESKIIIPLYVFVPIFLDLSITAILVRYFQRSQTGLAPLDALLRRTSYLAFEAAALPTLARILAGLGYIIHDRSLLFFCAMITGKVYVLAYLRALNVRPSLRRRAQVVRGRHSLECGIVESESIEFTSQWHSPSSWSPHPHTSPPADQPVAPHERRESEGKEITFLEAIQLPLASDRERRRSSEATYVGDMETDPTLKAKAGSKLENIGEADGN
ncbi:hypothetical protein EXIGLDRAFT_763735 [Exidia glandulosa HHB12029]|uniref:DUF6534 domain-containing protein n=1 Tax=Exidia glandulosa HHB12029 TaxID=1314781 RepID=A0A166B6B6_EXIGL|nr:hypothetical protein EXIGLDRAFT_763735 [Exidia glandulosa HHB12029]